MTSLFVVPLSTNVRYLQILLKSKQGVKLLDLGSIIGLALGVFCTVLSILLTAGFSLAKATGFVDAASAMIVFGGCIASVLISVTLPVAINGLKSVSIIFKPIENGLTDTINRIILLSNIARKEGVLALEETVQAVDDEFLKKGIMLVVDGTDPELVRTILENEVAFIEERHKQSRTVWENIASMAPAWGMIGTLIGLIMLLGNLNDPDSLGPSMAIALVTTFYGAILANLFAIPVANKLKFFSQSEILVKEVAIEGILAIQSGENPRIIEERLKSYLSPMLRTNIGADTRRGRYYGDDD